jgi:CRISPR/Cas system Type II protein with McrA/HNH and RuvC-like nuclease domain
MEQSKYRGFSLHQRKQLNRQKNEIEKLRLWEEQGCISPYTMKPIPLSMLFSPERLYDIDHIIPKSRFLTIRLPIR